jgi:hypothetical protein
MSSPGPGLGLQTCDFPVTIFVHFYVEIEKLEKGPDLAPLRSSTQKPFRQCRVSEGLSPDL